jgi:phosphatidylethanolamine/phosphatidyl-N-methylethanolamine N-methyltransferase
MEMVAAPHQSRIYHNLSRFYDGLFAPFFRARIHQTIRSLKIAPASRVLEVGVGTGLSLEAYPEHAEVLGIDLSTDMLLQAQEKVDRHGWKHIQLQPMDALNLELPDAAFDYVTAFHIVSVVPDHRRCMQEVWRVCKPGGTIVIINHLRSERPWIASTVDWLNPVTNRLGWQTKLRYEDLLAAAPIEVVRRFKTSWRSLFTVIVAKKPLDAADRSGS